MAQGRTVLAFACASAIAVVVVVGPSVAEAAPHGVRLTYFADPSTSIAVSWSSTAAGDNTIDYGTSPTQLTQTATAAEISQPSPLGHSFTAKLTGLVPGTTYYYRVSGYPTAGADPFSFSTHPAEACDPFRFVVIGDNRQDLGDSANPVWGDILEEAMAVDPEFFLNTGDMVLDGNTPTQWASFLDISERGWARVPSILTLGNHDDSDVDGEAAYYNQLFELPRNTEGLEDYYSLDIGPVHFVSLNSQYSTPGSAELNALTAWLSADLAATTQPWKIVFFHKAIYTRGNHSSGEEDDGSLNAALVPIFDAHHVDIVFNGHSHNYERYAPSRGVDQAFGGPGRQLPAGPGAMLPDDVPDGMTGTTYIVTGGAGALTTDILGFTCRDAACTYCTGINLNCPQEVFDADRLANVVYDGKHNFVVVDVEANELRVEVRTTVAGNSGGGNIIDMFTMTKAEFDCDVVGPMPDAAPSAIDASTPSADAPTGPGAESDGGGCCQVNARLAGADLVLAALVLGLVLRRSSRRRRGARASRARG
jgi:hypothetical protein